MKEVRRGRRHTPANTSLVELRNISKSFGKVAAVKNVSLEIHPGEVVGLVGDNGAGKTTLVKIISGVHAPDAGEMWVRGEKMQRWTSAMARNAGIETVYQDKALAEQQTIVRNIFIGRELGGPLGFLRIRAEREEAERLMRSIGFTSKAFSPDSIVATLSGGERQGVALARALYFEADLVILDEPTTALSLSECEEVFNFIRRLKAEGRAVIFISHNLYHVYQIADRFLLLDRGELVRAIDKHSTSADELIEHLRALVEIERYGIAGGSGAR